MLDTICDTFRDEYAGFPVYGITKNIHTNNLLKITFHEVAAIWQDVKRAPDLKSKFNYIFNSPGWSHDGEDQRAKTLQKDLK